MNPTLRSTTYNLDDMRIIEHWLSCPLNHAEPDGPNIDIFARELVALDDEKAGRPMLLYLQGGPGFESPRPLTRSGWIDHALNTHRVLLLDQRGTGLSAPITADGLLALGPTAAQMRHLLNFRADQIVLDAELYRIALLGIDEDWDVLGQSFGGFCALHYLSAYPSRLRSVLFTGGLPPIADGPDDVYTALFPRVNERTQAYFARYPNDRRMLGQLAHVVDNSKVCLPSGTRLKSRTLQQLGILLGASDGFERLHYCLEQCRVFPPQKGKLPFSFRTHIDALLPFNTNPLYALLHEAIYCQGYSSRWSAQRIRDRFNFASQISETDFEFTGEMVFPWMFEDYGELSRVRPVADALAEHDDWPRLYDADALASNRVPCAAAIYEHDMYVERRFSLETASRVNGMKTWLTDEYDHNGLRVAGELILKQLQSLVQLNGDS